MIEHESWHYFTPQEGESRQSQNGLEIYTQRINQNVCVVDKSVLAQSFYGLYDFSAFRNEYSCIDYFNVRFLLESWANEEIDKIQPPPYGRECVEQRIKELKNVDGRIEKTSYGHLHELVEHWRMNGTWTNPIIVIHSSEFPEFDFAKPYQLFEGHNRLSWEKYFIHNSSDLQLANEHLVWVLHKAH